MNRLKLALGLSLLAAGALIGCYHVLLTDSAKKSLKDSYASISGAYTLIHDNILDARGIDMGDCELPNQQATRMQWESLGY